MKNSVEFADRYWAEDYFGMPLAVYRAAGTHVIPHGGDLTGYHGIFILRRADSCVVSCPADRVPQVSHDLRMISAAQLLIAQNLPSIFPQALSVIGPARVSYLEDAPPIGTKVSAQLVSGDGLVARLSELQSACSPQEWEWSGLGANNEFMVGCVRDGRIVAAAGYELWRPHLAHIGVVAHPALRGHGFGRIVVEETTRQALSKDLAPQYRTLVANVPAIRLGESLGFRPYAETIAVRLPGKS